VTCAKRPAGGENVEKDKQGVAWPRADREQINVRYTSQGSTGARNRVTFLVLSFAQRAWCRSTGGSTSARAKKKDAAWAGQSSGPVRYASSLSKPNSALDPTPFRLYRVSNTVHTIRSRSVHSQAPAIAICKCSQSCPTGNFNK
jgi:hypothetical protein